MANYNIIGSSYNVTRKADPFIVQQLLHLLAPKKDLKYIDIGCGTGNYTIALFESGITIQGLEPSEKMLAVAYSKNDEINWTIGVAENLPFKDNYFSGAIATLTIHHWQDLNKSFKEIYRVIKPGGHLIIFTATAEQMQNYWLMHYFPLMMKNAIQQMPSLADITQAANTAGFELSLELPYFVQDDLQDLFLYSGKSNPSFYLNNNARQNISSFASLSSNEEVAFGANMLSADITNGKFDAVKKSFDDEKGDYLFLKICKPG
ncbi:class I SAM-dependent methyltransferase [Mucilaginibacter xinganensis]|uniref:Ubiquinone/menaquinone biosynthesis C-methylase UbiE n=1 Tax=Mucilaginibacter xinganensis TaxID=1234841 RepID=A0A223P1R5_9SPHI|nr:class I SAM-dependent methyltransferase [Mucilaginibacter xinganensis]ASU35884.1 Ubiquinone/menaquinone biosynthesis C-methylase UbiE [Mucilaginibacter xinganensis]